MPDRPIEEQDLLAFVEDQIDDLRRLEIEAWLAERPTFHPRCRKRPRNVSARARSRSRRSGSRTTMSNAATAAADAATGEAVEKT